MSVFLWKIILRKFKTVIINIDAGRLVLCFKFSKILSQVLIVDSHSFFAGPHPAVLLNADSNLSLQKCVVTLMLCKQNYLMQSFL